MSHSDEREREDADGGMLRRVEHTLGLKCMWVGGWVWVCTDILREVQSMYINSTHPIYLNPSFAGINILLNWSRIIISASMYFGPSSSHSSHCPSLAASHSFWCLRSGQWAVGNGREARHCKQNQNNIIIMSFDRAGQGRAGQGRAGQGKQACGRHLRSLT